MPGFSTTANVTDVMAGLINYLAGITASTLTSSENLKTNPSSNADAYAIVTGGVVVELVIVRGGSGYLSAPTVSFSGGNDGSDDTNAAATAVLTNGVVTSFTITNAGSGYSTPPNVSIVDSPDSATITGNGTTKTFAGGLGHIPVSPGSVSIEDADGVEVFTDLGGDGKLTSTLGGSGTINYLTGAVSLTFHTAPGNTKNIKSTYTYGRFSQFKVERNSSAFGGPNVVASYVDNFSSLPYQITIGLQRMDIKSGVRS